jgi:hypothetical protein
MTGPCRTFLFGSLAMNQTVFFEALGTVLGEAGHRIAYLCFHERSHEYLSKQGRRSFNAFTDGRSASGLDFSRYGWPSLNLILSHEKAAFEIFDSALLLRKLARYLAAAESAFDTLQSEAPSPVVLVQELGGFLSNMASFYCARRRGAESIFIEPSFFAGRVFFTRNGFAAPQVPGPRSAEATGAVMAYLDDAIARQKVVIPVKDVHHYRGPIRKLTDLRNMRRLVEKSVDKHLFRKGEEFSHLGGHIARHTRMLVNSWIFARHYQPMPEARVRFVYYPLHVPADVSLTIRSPQFVDQLALVDLLARAVPDTHAVLIKEHPALVGAVDRKRLLGLLKTRDNVHLLDPTIKNYEVLRRADAVVTVNSKSGAEALLLGRPVVVLGDAFYTPCDLVHKVESLADLPGALARILGSPRALEASAVRRYFQDVWDASWPGELHVSTEADARALATSLLAYVERGVQ